MDFIFVILVRFEGSVDERMVFEEESVYVGVKLSYSMFIDHVVRLLSFFLVRRTSWTFYGANDAYRRMTVS